MDILIYSVIFKFKVNFKYGVVIFCSNCSKEMSAAAKSCPSCGHPNIILGQKSKVAFVLLAIFLGGIGVHRMYIGDVGLGILYLLFCWTGIPMFVAFIEAIVIGLRKNDPRFDT
jgi:DNA-directed RNA polymerase subunit RPC12/RpoP